MRRVVAALVVVGALLVAPTTATASVMLVGVTVSVRSFAPAGTFATLTVAVSSSHVTCSIRVSSGTGPSHAARVYRRQPHAGRVSWTWKLGTRTMGRWAISVSCGSAGSLRTSVVIT
jgi:hypothetical protein